MLQIIFEIIFGTIGEFLLQFVVGILVDRSFEALHHAFQYRKEAKRYQAFVGYFILGSFLGILSYWIIPKRVIPLQGIPGLSLVLVPLFVGFGMSQWGKYQIRKGSLVTNLASFNGGAIFAFGISLFRFLFFLRGV